MIKKGLLTIALALFAHFAMAIDLTKATITYPKNDEPLVRQMAQVLVDDIERATGIRPQISGEAGTSVILATASQAYTPNINIGNVASNNFSSPTQQTFEFDITEQGDYVIALYSAASEWSDCIIGQLSLTANSYVTTSIETPIHNQAPNTPIYDIDGQRVISPTKSGIYISNGKKIIKR